MYRLERRCDRELSDCVDDVRPNCHAAKVAIRRGIVGSYNAFPYTLIAVVLQHRLTTRPMLVFGIALAG